VGHTVSKSYHSLNARGSKRQAGLIGKPKKRKVKIYSLKQLKYLTKVVMLGCMNIKEEEIIELIQNLNYLEEIDLGGTSITSATLK